MIYGEYQDEYERYAHFRYVVTFYYRCDLVLGSEALERLRKFNTLILNY